MKQITEPLFAIRSGSDGADCRLVRGYAALKDAITMAMYGGRQGEFGELPEDIQEMLAVAGNPNHEEWRESNGTPALYWGFEDGFLEVWQIMHDEAQPPAPASDTVAATGGGEG